jgi:hypothetical protein
VGQYRDVKVQRRKERRPVEDEAAPPDVGEDPLSDHQLSDSLADPLSDGGGAVQMTEAQGEDRSEDPGSPPGFDAGAKAAQLHAAIDGWGTDERAILDVLYTGRADLTKQIEKAYDRTYSPPLKEELRDELSGDHLAKALQLLSAGGLTLADKIREAASGWGTNEDKIFNALDRASANELNTIRNDPDLVALLQEELGGSDWQLANAYLQGQGALAGKLRRAVDGWGTDEAVIWRELEGASQEERQFVLKQPALMNHLRSDLGAADWMKCERMLRGTIDNVDRLEVAMEGWGTDEQGISNALKGLTAQEYARVPEDIDSRLDAELGGGDLANARETLHQKRLQFDNDYRRDWAERQQQEHGEGYLKHEGATALIGNNREAQSAVGRLEAACKGAGTDDDTVWDVIGKLTPAERDFIRTHNPDGVLDTLRGDLSDGDYDRAMAALAGGGGASTAAMLEKAVDGWGTDERQIYDALERVVAEGSGLEVLANTAIVDAVYADVTERQAAIFDEVCRTSSFSAENRFYWATSGSGTDEDLIFEIAGQYGTAVYDGNELDATIDELLRSELDNRDYWRTLDLIRGEPKTESERLERAKEQLERERGSTVSAGLMDMFSHSGENADDAWREYQGTFNEAHADGEVTAEETETLRRDERFSQHMTSEYREAKAAVAQWATQIAVAIVGIAATILTAGAAGPFAAALAASLGGKVAVAAEAMVLAAALKVGLNRAIQGEGYDVTSSQALIDACSASIEVGLNMVGGAVATKMVSGMGKSAVGRTVGPAVEKVFGKAGKQILGAGLEGGIDGAIGGIGEGTFLALANENNWEGEVEDLFANLGTSVATNTAMSAAGGFMAGAAFKSLGETFGPKVSGQMGDAAGEVGEGAGDMAARMKALGAQLDDEGSATIAKELQEILDGSLKNTSGQMNGAQFNKMMDDLADFAQRYEVLIGTKLDTVGVFPKGLNEIQLSGFGKMDDLAANVGFAKRHELAHVFHTLQTRATLLDSVKKGRISLEQANMFIDAIETGANYRQFEKVATASSSAAHLNKGAKDVALYAGRLEDMLGNVRLGLHNGKMAFPTGQSFQDVYALFLSKAPAVVGTSMKDLALRMPPIMFASLYLANVDVTAYGITPVDWGIQPPGGGGSMGFRDFINRMVTDSS